LINYSDPEEGSPMEFHISRQARDRYQFDQSIYSFNGNAVFANFHAARTFAQKMNRARDLVQFPEQAVKAGQINAMGLIDEILHLMVALYRQQKNPQVMLATLERLEKTLGLEKVNQILLAYTSEFPPLPVYRREQSAAEYLAGTTDGFPNRANVLEELLLLWVSNRNPALSPYLELFDEENLKQTTEYTAAIREMYDFLDTQPPFGPDQQNLIDLLRAPALAHPYSLTEQLENIRRRWIEYIGSYLYRLLGSLDLIKEEEKLPFLGPGPVPIPVYDRAAFEGEAENFSPDQEWMPRLVLIAKNTYVWLDQLSKKYRRQIQFLNEIPDEELDLLASYGFTGLWLIGLWERSQASARIKQLCGNPEAIASAYSLAAYRIADDLGGESAFQNLRERAWQRGIRLASDMVPNHMGIDSSWVLEHPDWFISLGYSPFPSYSFTGPDLSPDSRVGIFIEDHYYDRTDAAVVFKRVDRISNSELYIYHGNDGTSMPWNDTAQLNYLNPEVREAVIQTILSVARRFPIIRFDAAMTLAKRHYQRLWFPEPGTGGAIPSRADFGMTAEQFNQAFPVEFWREVVDRVAQEVPDTLLLAEAFWLMEGYFVRTLGMHRVYNSAFMNMLRNEENAKYRTLIKNTLEFEPEILKRYVNFMNNPDERTALDQFGKGDKYFGICAMMATLPGLPMFGHGQIEGFAEKYGMEFRRAYWDEQPDPYLVERHKREISPLLHRRALFADVENFLLFDYYTTGGWVDENVFAYSNQMGDQRSLVVYHNKFAQTSGWIRWSAATKSKSSDRLVQRTLAEALGLTGGDGRFVVFRDQINGLEYIRSSQEIISQGLFLNLNAYEYHVFLDFHEVSDDEFSSLRRLCESLAGSGVPNVREAMRELLLAPIMRPYGEIANPGYLRFLLENRLSSTGQNLPAHLLDEAQQKLSALLDGIGQITGANQRKSEILVGLSEQLETTLSLPVASTKIAALQKGLAKSALDYILSGLEGREDRWITLLVAIFLHDIGKMSGEPAYERQTVSWYDEWQLSQRLVECAQQLGVDQADALRLPISLRLILSQQRWYEENAGLPVHRIVENWLADPDLQRYLGVNRYKDVLWYSKEAFEDLIWWMVAVSLLQASTRPDWSAAHLVERLIGSYEIACALMEASRKSGFRISGLLSALREMDEQELANIPRDAAQESEGSDASG
jgi:glycosidase